MSEAFIYDHVRTPRGKGRPDGSLHELTAITLSTQVLQALASRNHLDTRQVDDVILGVVSPVGEQGSNIARISVINAGWAESVAGAQVHRFCASGLTAVNLAAAKVISGQADLAVGGGVESMSRIPLASDGGAFLGDPEVARRVGFVPQGVGADLIATLWGFSREDVDRYAVASQQRARMAWDGGRFAKSVIPVKDRLGMTVLDHDEHMRPDTTLQSLAALKPSFAEQGASCGFDAVALLRYPQVERIDHVHHAGNSSGIVDGAAAVLLGSRQIGETLGLRPRARIVSCADIGSEPTIMLTGPSFAAEKALRRAGMRAADIDLWELNEAFAAVVLRFMQALDIEHGVINVNGGAIALGHPLGATGAMLLGTALDELERSGQGTALIALCVGGGMGTATIIERL